MKTSHSCRMVFMLTAVLALASACEDTPSNVVITEDENIREVVLRFQFNWDASGCSPNGYYVAYATFDSNYHWRDLRDPPDRFMVRFADHHPAVKKQSGSTLVHGGGIYDIETGLRGELKVLGEVRRTSDTEAEIEAGYYCGGLSAEVDTYFLEKIDGQWWIVWFTCRGVA